MSVSIDPPNLEQQFHQEMINLCNRSSNEIGYDPRYLRRMISETGGLETARVLLNKKTVSEGFVELARHQRLDLAVEALIQIEPWNALFTQEEIEVARRRLL